MNDAVQWVDFLATAVFAITGALAAAEQKLDILGFVLFGTITGIGGGTVRDLLLGTDVVFWFTHTEYLWICIVSSAATFFMAPLLNSLHKVLLWADAVGMALFSALGAIKALQWGAPEIVAVGMGVMTATFGSLIRDTLLNQRPVLLEPEIYVTAAMLGAASCTLLSGFAITSPYALPVAICLAFALRGCAIAFDLRLPKYGD